MNHLNKYYHNQLAKYFSFQPLYLDGNYKKKTNSRKLMELPWQQTRANLWDEVTETLCNLEFIAAKCKARFANYLLEDFLMVLDGIPEAIEERGFNNEQSIELKKYANALSLYPEIQSITTPISITPWNNQKIEEERARMINNPDRLDKIREFNRFVGNSIYALIEEIDSSPEKVLELAYNFADSGPVGELVNNHIDRKNIRGQKKWSKNRSPFNPFYQNLKIFYPYALKDVFLSPETNFAILKILYKDRKIDEFRIVDTKTGRMIFSIQNDVKVLHYHILPGGKYIILLNADNEIKIWSIELRRLINSIHIDIQPIDFIFCRFDGKVTYIISAGNILKLDLESAIIIDTYKIQEYKLLCKLRGMKLICSGTELIGFLNKNELLYWNLNTGLISSKYQIEGFHINPKANIKIDFSTGTNHIILISDLGDIISIDNELKVLVSKAKIDHPLCSVSITPDNKLALIGAKPGVYKSDFQRINLGKLILWDIHKKQMIREYSGYPAYKNVSISVNGIYGMCEGFFLNLMNGQELITDKEDDLIASESKNSLYSYSSDFFSKEALAARTYANNNKILIWNKDSGEILKVLAGHSDSIKLIYFSPDGKTLITGGKDYLIILWNIETGEIIRKIYYKNLYSINAHALSNCGRYLILGSEYSTIDVIDFYLDKITELKGHTRETVSTGSGKEFTGTIQHLSIHPDGKRLISSNDFDEVICWDLINGSLIKKIIEMDPCNRVGISKIYQSSDGHFAVIANEKSCMRYDYATNECKEISEKDQIFQIELKSGERVELNNPKADNQKEIPYTTPTRAWDMMDNCYNPVFIKCPICDYKFIPESENELTKILHRKDNYPDINYNDCPSCKKRMRINPFICGDGSNMVNPPHSIETEKQSQPSLPANLVIEKTKETPFVYIDFEKGQILIKGVYKSNQEYAESFLANIKKQIEKIENNGYLEIHLDFYYFDARTAKHIVYFLKTFEPIFDNGTEILIYWYYPEIDAFDMQEAGDDLQSLMHINFIFKSSIPWEEFDCNHIQYFK